MKIEYSPSNLETQIESAGNTYFTEISHELIKRDTYTEALLQPQEEQVPLRSFPSLQKINSQFTSNMYFGSRNILDPQLNQNSLASSFLNSSITAPSLCAHVPPAIAQPPPSTNKLTKLVGVRNHWKELGFQEIRPSKLGRTSDKEKPEKNGTLFPCKARGMTMNHNCKTAYFIITPDVKNGDDLICSFEECRKQGVKFQFCATCKIPVAKRNFKKRHNHGNPDIITPASPPTFSTTLNNMPNENSAVIQKSIYSTMEKEEISTKGVAHNRPPSKIKPIFGSTLEMHLQDKTNRSETDPFTKLKIDQWFQLLYQRPSNKDHKALTTWMNNVLSVSDYEESNSSSVPTVGNLLCEVPHAKSYIDTRMSSSSITESTKPTKSIKRGPKGRRPS